MAIVDEKYQHESSFLATGPLRWIDNESNFKPTIYTSLKFITTAADQIEDRLKRVPASHSVKVSDLAASPKHLLFFICDLIAVIYPATIPMVVHYLTQISPSLASSTINIPTLVGLAIAMDLLRRHEVTTPAGSIETYLAPADPAGASRPFHHSRLLKVSALPTRPYCWRYPRRRQSWSKSGKPHDGRQYGARPRVDGKVHCTFRAVLPMRTSLIRFRSGPAASGRFIILRSSLL